MKESIRRLQITSPDVYHPPARFPRRPSVLVSPRPKRLDRLPLGAYRCLAFLISAIWAVGIIGIVMLSDHHHEAPNPFLAYHNMVPGKTRDAAIREGATCKSAVGSGMEPNEFCTFIPASGPFANVNAVIFNGRIITLNFTAKSNALFVGDLERLWGEPTVHPTANDGVVLLRWPAYHISATATHATRYSYSVIFLSVNYVVFSGDFALKTPQQDL